MPTSEPKLIAYNPSPTPKQGCANDDQQDPTRVIGTSIGVGADGQMAFLAGGFHGTPEELRAHMASAAPHMQAVYNDPETTAIYLPGGWLSLADSVDGHDGAGSRRSAPSPIYAYAPCKAPRTGSIPLSRQPLHCRGQTGPAEVPLFPGALVAAPPH